MTYLSCSLRVPVLHGYNDDNIFISFPASTQIMLSIRISDNHLELFNQTIPSDGDSMETGHFAAILKIATGNGPLSVGETIPPDSSVPR